MSKIFIDTNILVYSLDSHYPIKQEKCRSLLKALADDLRVLVEASLDRSQFARKWRNKRLAHIDLSLAVGAKATVLPGVSRQNVEYALASFRRIMNRLYGRLLTVN